MRNSSLLVTAFIAVCLLPGCNRADDSDRAAPAVASDPVPAPADATSDAVTMRYDCGEHRIDVMGNDHARVTMSDGRVIELAHVADSSPPLFSGDALEFSIDGDGAQLAQDEGASWPCSAE